MGCLEKVFGSFIGIACLIAGLAGESLMMIVAGALFAVLNLILPYEMFESLFDSIFQSEFGALLGKWVTLAGISFIAGIGVETLI